MKLFNKENILMYTVNKEKIGNNFSISIYNGEVIVSAPWYFTSNQIQRIVDEKRDWILEKIKAYEQTKAIKISNSKPRKALILGKEYIIDINFKNIKRPELNLNSEKIRINFPLQYKKKNIENMLEIVLRKMYQTIAENKIEDFMEKIRIKLGFAPEDYEIKKLSGKLADCIDMNKIVINPQIMKFDEDIIEYILMHEFCHLKYKTHSKLFQKIMEKNFENIDKVEKKLLKLNIEY